MIDDRAKKDLEAALGTDYTVERFTVFDQPRMKHFSRLWSQQQPQAEQKDAIGLAYLRHIIGIDEQTVNAFTHADVDPYAYVNNLLLGASPDQCFLDYQKAEAAVGERLMNADNCRNDYLSFWNDVAKIAPEICDDHEIGWLVQGGDWAVGGLLYQLCKTSSIALSRLHLTMHRYK